MEHSIVWELDWIKSELIMPKICSKPVSPKAAFMPRLVSVFNWQPLHLVNYLIYCGREKGKRTKAFVLWIAANKGINYKKAEHPDTERQLVWSLPVDRAFLEWLSLGKWKKVEMEPSFQNTSLNLCVSKTPQRINSGTNSCLSVAFAPNRKVPETEIGNKNIC